jgi:hypothetical protein
LLVWQTTEENLVVEQSQALSSRKRRKPPNEQSFHNMTNSSTNHPQASQSTILPSQMNRPEDQECDFYRNPTILSRLVQNQKYEAAMARLEKRGPAEVSVWVCTMLPTTGDASPKDVGMGSSNSSAPFEVAGEEDRPQYAYRQLPLHAACAALFRVADASLRDDLEALIAHLVVAYPEGCARRDHKGRLPLHEVIWHDASPDLVSAILMAYPGACQERDPHGRYSIELNEYRAGKHKVAVRSLLRRKMAFWVTAGTEAHLRLKHRQVPDPEASVASVSVVAASIHADDDTLFTRESLDLGEPDPFHPKASRQYVGPVVPLRWSQLEQRAQTLEAKLSESYEETYKLKQQMTQASVAKEILQAKVDRLLSGDYAKEIANLVMEKEDLFFQVRALKSRMHKFGLSLEPPSSSSLPETLLLPTSAQAQRLEQERLDEVQVLRDQVEQLHTQQLDFQKRKEKETQGLREQVWNLTLLNALYEENAKDTQPAKSVVSDFTKSMADDEVTESSSIGDHTPVRPDSEIDDIDDNDDCDTVLQSAMRLNGGQRLSPRLIELWNKVSVHNRSLSKIAEDSQGGKTESQTESESSGSSETDGFSGESGVEFSSLYKKAARRYGIADSTDLHLNAGYDYQEDGPIPLLPELCHDQGTPAKEVANFNSLMAPHRTMRESRDLTRPTIPNNHANEVSDLTMSLAPLDEADDGIGFAPRPAYRGPFGKAGGCKPVAQRNLMKGIDELPEPENIQVVRTHPMRDISEMSMSFALL